MFNSIINKITLAILSVFSILTLDSYAYEKFPNPVIFIHGLNGDAATTWKDFGKILSQNQLTIGGCVTFNRSIGGVIQDVFVQDLCESTTRAMSPGDFYLMQFSDNHNLTFRDQAEELQAIIDAVSTVNGQAKVILVAHSMGGLAARSYLQQLAPTSNKVLKLITVGTPHMGADIASLIDTLHIPTFSRAVAELDPRSQSLRELNDLINLPLPDQISYTSIIGIGGAFIIGDGDGVVSASSQDLGNVITMNIGLHLHHTAKSIDVVQCHIFDIRAEVHTCETSNTKILTEVLYQIYECDILNSGDPVLVGYGASWDVFNPTHLLLKAYCFASAISAQVSPAMYVYSQGYAWTGGWTPVTFSCTGGALVSNAWCPNSAAAPLPNTAIYYAAYTCQWRDNQWKCGCRDQACTTGYWQLQQIRR